MPGGLRRALTADRQLAEERERGVALAQRLDEAQQANQALRNQLGDVERTSEFLTAAKSVAKSLARLEQKRDEASLDVALLDYPKAEIFLRIPTVASLGRIRACRKEPWTVEWIEKWLRPGQTLYDIGANVGAYSLVAAKSSAGAAQIVAIEPGAATFAALCENVALNGAEAAVIPLPVALSSRTSLLGLRYSDRSAGSASHSVEAYSLPAPAAGAQPILTFALDELIGTFGLPAPNHIKLDVDGCEPDVLAGAGRTLASPELVSALVEVHPAASGAIDAAFGAAGFVGIDEFRAPPKPGREPAEHGYRLYARSSDAGEPIQVSWPPS